jgi:hypothetical protein
MRLDNDFSDILHESRFEKQRPMLIALLIVIATIVAVSWAVFAYLGQSSHDNAATSTDTSVFNDDMATDEMSETSTTEETPGATGEISTKSPTASDAQPTANQPNGSSSSSTYDPSKCDPLKSQVDSLKTASDQKKTTYDNAFAVRKSYGDIYSEVRIEYGDSSAMYQAVKAESDRRYNSQEAKLNFLQTDWQDVLNKQNAAYGKYQECRANL